jgi:hypothetical protein
MGYTALGDRDRALAALEKSFASRQYPVLHIKANPMWDDLRPDPRFRDLLRRLKLDEGVWRVCWRERLTTNVVRLAKAGSPDAPDSPDSAMPVSICRYGKEGKHPRC